MLRRFLSEVSADGPFRFIATREPGRPRPYHRACAGLDPMIAAVAAKGNDQRDVWFTTACFSTDFSTRVLPDGSSQRITGRHVQFAIAAKALFVDIDIKADASHYHDMAAAMTGLRAFLDSSGVPMPTWVVGTGGGLHVWWALTEPLLAARWRPLAARLKSAAIANKLLCDASITQDISRLMRVPGTNNVKLAGNPRPVRATRTGVPIDPAQLEQILAGYDGTLQASKRPGPSLDEKALAFAQTLGVATPNAMTPPADYVPTNELGEGVQLGTAPVDMNKVVQRCVLLQNVVASGGAGLSEEAWKNTLHCAAWAETTPEVWAHAMSKGHVNYDPATTNTKFYDRVSAKAAGVGPITCKTFGQSELGSHCTHCRYRGRVASPIQFGRDNFHLLRSRPEWDIAPDGSTIKAVVDSTGATTWQPRFIDYKFHNHTLISTADDELHLAIDVELRGTTNKHKINVKSLADLRSFKRGVGGFMSGSDATLTDLLGYSEGWVQELRNSVRHVKDGGQLGWIERGGAHGLRLGDVTVWNDGTVEGMAPAGLMAAYGTKGSADRVTDALKLLLAGPPELMVPIAAAYAAPICALTNQQGAVVAMLGLTGAGKSSALRTGAAIWGNPARSMCVMTDTTNAAVKRLGMARHLPVFWDEAAVAADAANFVNLIFQIVTGRGKSRLSANSEMMPIETYCTMFLVGTNDHMRERIAALSQMADAGVARLLEIFCPKLVRTNGHLYARVFAALDEHYGHYGRAWATYLVTHREEVKKTFIGVMDALSKRMPDPEGEHRYQLIAAAQLYTGLIYFKKLTGLPVDLGAFATMLEVSVMRRNDPLPGPARLDGNSVETAEMLMNTFIADHREGIVMTPEVRFHQPAQMDELPNLLHEQLRGKLVGHHSVQDKRIWLSVEDIKVWCERRKIPYSGVLTNIRKSPAFVDFDRVGIGFNTRWIKQPNVTMCLILDLKALGHD